MALCVSAGAWLPAHAVGSANISSLNPHHSLGRLQVALFLQMRKWRGSWEAGTPNGEKATRPPKTLRRHRLGTASRFTSKTL